MEPATSFVDFVAAVSAAVNFPGIVNDNSTQEQRISSPRLGPGRLCDRAPPPGNPQNELGEAWPDGYNPA
jgi:hypothetical protein